jgi:hypothetical protein
VGLGVVWAYLTGNRQVGTFLAKYGRVRHGKARLGSVRLGPTLQETVEWVFPQGLY